MSFERDHRRARPFRIISRRNQTTGQGSRASGRINGDGGAISQFACSLLHGHAAHLILFDDEVRHVRIFQHMRAGVAGATKQTLIHFGATQTERDAGSSEPGTRHAGAAAVPRIKNSFS